MSTVRVLFVSLSDDMGTDRLVSDTGRRSASCAVLGPDGCVASLPRCVSARFVVPPGFRGTIAFWRTLERAVAAWRPDQVVPLDDLSATLLRSLARKARPLNHLRRLLRASLGAPDGYDAACGRVALMEAARRAGVRVPAFTAADLSRRRLDLGGVPLPVMVKRDQSSGSGGVVRAATARQVAQAVRRGWLKTAIKAQLARFAGLGRPVTPVLVQAVVEGRLAMYTAACREGRLIDGAGFEAVKTHPVKGSSTILRHCPHDEMAEAARRLVAALGCSGFVSFDFIIDAAGRAHLIEMNARPVGSAHLGRRFGHDLVHAFLTGASAGGEPSAMQTGDIALFPKELERDPSGRHLDDGRLHHDVPVHEPAVIAAYLMRLQAEHPAHAAELARRCGADAGAPAAPAPTRAHPEPC